MLPSVLRKLVRIINILIVVVQRDMNDMLQRFETVVVIRHFLISTVNTHLALVK